MLIVLCHWQACQCEVFFYWSGNNVTVLKLGKYRYLKLFAVSWSILNDSSSYRGSIFMFTLNLTFDDDSILHHLSADDFMLKFFYDLINVILKFYDLQFWCLNAKLWHGCFCYVNSIFLQLASQADQDSVDELTVTSLKAQNFTSTRERSVQRRANNCCALTSAIVAANKIFVNHTRFLRFVCFYNLT